MIDCFIRVFSSNELRLGFAIATVARWKMQKDVRVHVIQWKDGIQYYWPGYKHVQLKNDNDYPFAALSLKYAEDFSRSDPYIVCNDDNLILTPDFVKNGLRVMEENQEFGCVSGVVTNGEGSEFELNGKEDIHEIHAVGGCVFLRKGIVKEFPALEDPYWDIERHRQVIAAGFKSGYTRHCPYLHMGAKFSIASPAWFTGA